MCTRENTTCANTNDYRNFFLGRNHVKFYDVFISITIIIAETKQNLLSLDKEIYMLMSPYSR